MITQLKYCYVTGGIRNLNFHAWLNEITIERLKNEGCEIEIIKPLNQTEIKESDWMTIDEVEKIKTVVENKDYIVQLVNVVAKTMVEAFENLKIEDVNMFQLGYNKAIDDLLGGMNQITYNCQDADELFEKICDLAEQLKAGEVNE